MSRAIKAAAAPAARRVLSVLALVAVATALLSAPSWARPAGGSSGASAVRATIVTASTPPKVTKQPANQTVEEGQSASFSSTASGTPTPTLQWEVSTDGGATWSAIEGATSSPLVIASAKTSESANEYRAVFKNSAGEAISKAATLTVRKAPVVTKQPANTTVEEGQNAVFEAAAAGAPAPTVQWQTSANGGATWTNVAGATSEKLTITNAKTTLSGHQYRAVFKNVAGTATSEAATLTVQKAPAVTKQPAGTTVREGQTAVFEASASGFPAPTVQWEISTDAGATWAPVEGATSTQLTVPNAQISEDGHEYRAVFTNAAGSATSEAATLTVHNPPQVTEDPLSVTVQVGESATFEAEASGFPAPTVQWEVSTDAGKTFSAVAGATSDQLTIANAQAAENGNEYRATFTNAAGTATSASATLTVATNKFNAVAWGQNNTRQLGDGLSNAFSDVPVPVSGLKFVTAVSAGGHHSLALLANGTVMAWGSNASGQLGNGGTGTPEVPVEVQGLTGVKEVAAGGAHSLALLTNGTVMAWGNNESGQLGTGNNTESEVPVAVKGLTNVKAIAAGANHSLALLTNGTVMAWGENEDGQLGNASTKSSNVPVAVKGLTGVAQVSAGGAFSLALLSNATVKGWGSNQFGQLANSGVEESSDVPVAVGGLSGVAAVSAGAQHALALLGGGTVMAWGEDSFGELGDGTIKTSEETPVAVTGLSGVTAVSAGGQDSAALIGGSVMAWGINQFGQLGDGTTGSPSDVPVTVGALRKAASVSAGGSHMVAYGEPLAVVTSVSPKLGPVGGGNPVTITGTNFTGEVTVKFGATPASGVTVNSATSITATAPAGSGTVDVTVSTPSGTSPTGSADRYTYQLNPTVTRLLPKAGPSGGGTSVTITGTEFTGASKVSFGAVEATQFTVNSATSITVLSPPATVGTVDVTVTNSSATSATSTMDRFKYTPTVEGVAPNAGPVAGGTSVTVTGTGFALGSATMFKFGKTKAASVNCTSATTCTMLAPAHAAGTVDVTAVVAKVTSPVNAPGDQFAYS